MGEEWKLNLLQKGERRLWAMIDNSGEALPPTPKLEISDG